jgi:biopolymer transport protein ExbB
MISKIFKAAVIAGLAFSLGNTAYAAQAVSLDELLAQVKTGRVKDAAENKKRIAEFQANRGRQHQLLRNMEAEKVRQEQISVQLEASFDANDALIIDLERALIERLGELKELFGVLQQAAGDARGNFDTSVTQIQFPDRGEWLTEFAQKMGSTTRMPTLGEIERIWFELQREMTESARVVKVNTTVINANGEEEQRDVVRVGLFNVVSDGKYLEYVPETGRLVELQRQPAGRYTGRAGDLQDATGGLNSFAIDPTRGQLLALLVQSPSLMERIAQGKQVGYVIIVLGIIAITIAVWRLLSLSATSAKVHRQIKNVDQPGNNPLGHVLKIAQDNPDSDVEALELKLGEAILKELPKFNSMLSFLKIISVVAPLLGLLGTVTGMIVTFQAITLYGAGDPKLMAGGISTALVTTVLGLVVAIPTVFMHTLVQSRAKRLTQILQEEAAGMLSERAERRA